MNDNAFDVDDESESRVSRRRLVAAGAAGWATVSLAGCSRVLDPSMRDDETDTETEGTDTGGDGGQQTTQAGNTTVTNETTTTGDPGGETTTTGAGTTECASYRRFAPGMEIGLHVELFDNDSGSFLADDAIEGVTIEFPDADYGPVELNWEGDHEAYSETTWGGKIVTSEDADPGTYRYEISVDRGDDELDTIVDEFTIV
jgi:hypothetical protein